MPPQIALLSCIFVMVYLFWADRGRNKGVSRGIWIPFFWMFLAGSRYVSYWLDLGEPMTSVDVYLEGSPADRNVFLFLMIAGALIVIRRRPNWGELFKNNVWMWLFFIFGATSILWSDYPLISFKRWIKALGNVIMALVILTEQGPRESIEFLLKRLAFVLLPLSVLFIKYYPNLGRTYHMGSQMFTGVAGQKNGLGQLCLISGIYFAWSLLLNHEGKDDEGQPHFSSYLIVLPMLVWLFYKANSATSLVCMIFAVGLFMVGRQPVVAREPRRILTITIVSIALFGGLELLFDFSEIVITILGRKPDLTTRVPMWRDILAMVKDPLIGFGYGSFLLGDRKVLLGERWGVSMQAHNGYLQVYMDLGVIGLLVLVCWILSGVRKVANHLTIDFPTAVLRLCFILVVALYNWTEATFFGVSNMWILFLLGVIDVHVSGAEKSNNTI